MPVVSTTQDPEALTLTLVTDLAAPPSRVWQVWSDPRQLERWWGPPTWPATFEEHDVVPGGGSRYFTRMTVTSQLGSLEQMEQLVRMGMVEGLTQAVNQVDALLAAA